MMHTVGRRPREGTAGDVQDVRRHRASETRRRRGPAGYEAGGRWRLVFWRAATAFLLLPSRLGTRSDRAAAPGLEAAEAEFAAATRATGVVAIEPRRALGRRGALDAGRAIHRERGVLDLELVAAAAPDAVEFSDIGRLGDIG